PHTVLRGDDGRLRHEECLTRDGFDGPFTILYHLERPHVAAVSGPAHGWQVPAGTGAAGDRPLARRHYRTPQLPHQPGPAIDRRVPLLANEDLVLSVVRADAADPVYFANGDADDLYFVLEGGGTLRTALG